MKNNPLTEDKLEDYILQHIDTEPELLQRLYREAHQDLLWARMMSGHLQGRILRMICQMVRPHRVLELGTFAGYSALCIAEALSDDALIHTMEINDELKDFAQRFFDESPHGHKIKLHIGDATLLLSGLNEVFDLVFIDADKRHYVDYYEAVFEKVVHGGYLIADNVLWSGKVVGKVVEKDKQTQGVLAFNELIAKDERVEKVILPIRDGMTLIRKK